ncbi:MAG: hypothetical protein KME16_20740 [Scytolyngbya sp. HA4215-MV1]|jgi:hypothetical protein|nr:hypothetical protein [Scytolyngbya sp. HA4215-MV1]
MLTATLPKARNCQHEGTTPVMGCFPELAKQSENFSFSPPVEYNKSFSFEGWKKLVMTWIWCWIN